MAMINVSACADVQRSGVGLDAVKYNGVIVWQRNHTSGGFVIDSYTPGDGTLLFEEVSDPTGAVPLVWDADTYILTVDAAIE